MKNQNEFIKQLEQIHSEILLISKKEKKKTGFCIGNTAQKIDRDYFFSPLRNTSLCVCGSIVIDKVSIAEKVAKFFDGKVNYIFVDTEKKISPQHYGSLDAGNVERTVRTIARKSKVLTYKGNDITVDSIDAFLAQLISNDIRGLGGKKIAIIGVGNIGFKLALKFTERGAHVVLVRRDTKILNTIIKALNYIKPKGTIARISGTNNIKSALKNADIVIGLTPGTQDIKPEMLYEINKNAVLIDAGKGSFSSESIELARKRNIQIFRTSIESGFEGQVSMLLHIEEYLKKKIGRKQIEGISIVSSGLQGYNGEIVVDNISSPGIVYGMANGCGDFIRNLSAEEKIKIDRLKKLINNK